MKGYLVLENGDVYEGEQIGYSKESYFELVFTTGMSGYIETFTDPTYAGQGVVMTYPVIGNYGVMPEDFESDNVWVKAVLVHTLANFESNFRSKYSLEKLLRDNKIPGLSEINTRKLTKALREHGTMKAAIVSNIDKKDEIINKIKEYKVENKIDEVTTKQIKEYGKSKAHRVGLIDYGFKHSIVNSFLKRDIGVTVFPAKTPADEILRHKLDGIVLSNGPGNPEECKIEIENVKRLYREEIPMFGIGLGHQLVGLATGAKVEKLKYGHRGSSQPIKDVKTGRVYMTSQNHGYHLKESSINSNLADVSYKNLNDNTVEGLKFKNKKITTVQFSPEATDTEYIFDEFAEEVRGGKINA